MKKILYITCAFVFSLVLFFVLLFSSMEILVYNLNYYEAHYEKRNIMEDTNLELDELMIVTEKMLDYLKNDRDSLDMEANFNGNVEEVFGQREKLHMEDVKDLFVKATWIRNISVIIILLMGILSYRYSKSLFVYILKKIKWFFAGILACFLVLGVLFYLDFNKYFTLFHLIFFNNDLWLLDPNTDVLLNMVPEGFFFETTMIVMATFGLSIIMTLLLARFATKRIKTL